MTVTGATAVAWWWCLSWDERSSKVSQLTNIENLSTDECWRLLACQQIGRLAVADDEGVHIFPVNYLVDGGAIAIRSEANALIRCAPLHRVEFEVDHIDCDDGTGWAVVADGTAQLITDALDTVSEHTRALTPPNWSHRPKPEWLRIDVTHIVGVRLVGDLGDDIDLVESETARSTRSDLLSRRLLDEVRIRLIALTQTHSTEEANAETLRHGADQLETIARRLHWLADMTDELPFSRVELTS
jgi:nitroimidazol reductase NimA-like FMN-containing flavoprotein (pyridoxamine 5'-phosphate oxidase superfamily)